jgi:hypothetical protein
LGLWKWLGHRRWSAELLVAEVGSLVGFWSVFWLSGTGWLLTWSLFVLGLVSLDW